MASTLLLSGCQAVTEGYDDYRLNPDVEFNTTINYDELEQCSYDESGFNDDYNDYSFRLMAQIMNSEDRDTNVMISPASIMFAMDLTAAGANGNTLTQITDLFSEGADPMEQQAFAASMMERINSSEDVDFNTANAIWTNQSLVSCLNPEYQDYIGEYYDAEANLQPFNQETVNEINSWIEEHTNGMIDQVLDELEPETVAVLVNAITFEGFWSEAYEDSQVHPMIFTTADGDEISVHMLCDRSDYCNYYETDKAIGFMRYYGGGQYAFLVMLPTDDSISANEFLSEFTAEDYSAFIDSRTDQYVVLTRMPEFESEYEIDLNSILQDLGAVDAFNENRADFTGLAAVNNGNIYIESVIHKTRIELDRNGTRASGATVPLCEVRSAITYGETREVYCDRPFAYAIVDTETMNPIFFGTFNG